MSQRKQLIFAAIGLLNYLCCAGALASDPADKDITSSKHYHFPFVSLDVARHKDGSKNVDVKAPFTEVHNPAGPDNAQVKAPFTKVDHSKDGTANNITAPRTDVQKSANKKQQTNRQRKENI
jgi:hypothetical protein